MASLKTHYLRIYREADAILRAPGNPCHILVDDKGVPSCVVSRGETPSGSHLGFTSPSLCCGGCRHLGPKGCTVDSLSCKLGWCYTSHNAINGLQVGSNPVFIAINELRKEAISLGVPLPWRQSSDETFTR